MKPRKKSFDIKKIVIALSAILVISFIVLLFSYLNRIYFSNVIDDGKEKYIQIKTGSTFEDVCNELIKANVLSNINSFEWLAEKKDYVKNIKPGRYKIGRRMSNKELIRMLKLGEQEPVRVIINNVRTINQLGGLLSRQLEIDSAELVGLLSNKDYLIGYYLNPQTSLSIFIPNTYEFYWNTNAQQLIKRIYKESEIFWNENRRKKAEELGLSTVEITILASIVEEETNVKEEYPVIAGVYINRLKKGMMLQADPTIKFALGNFAIKRILTKDTEVKSEYNTYRHKGLPPGLICMPSINAIDGVLNYERHKYLYFCAKSDFSGKHDFAKSLVEHNKNAEAYWKELNKQKIYE
jgi:UPF0755 protein